MSEKPKMQDFLKSAYSETLVNRDEFISACEKSYDSYVDKTSLEKQVEGLLKHLCGGYPHAHPPYILGLYEAFTNWDMRHLLNVLYQSSRNESLGRRMSSAYDHRANFWSNYDHCFNFWVSIKAFAANDVRLVQSMLPKELGISKNGHVVMKTGVNLMMALLYQDGDMLKVSRKAALKWLSGKRSVFDRAVVEYLLALTENDTGKAAASLKQVCEGTRKIGDIFFMPKLEKHFCIYAHGLYNFAYFALPAEDFSRLNPPDDKGFIRDFAQWNIENDFPQGILFLPMPERLGLLNILMEIDQPDEKLIKKAVGSKSSVDTDGEAFLAELVERVRGCIPNGK